jgi:hypothetical protein|tara:strand:+ start:258 stop:863 length:606 start_codon:yes stop_codon:yes gene_type:complete
MTFPTKLVEAVEYLSGLVTISEDHEDGRVNSITDEDTVIDLLIKKYGVENVEKPPARFWWDIKLFGFPLNIKSSDFLKKASDNFSAKAAILYALTDLPEDEVVTTSWKKFQNALKNHSGEENNRDYYIIVVDKNTSKVYLQSLKSLQKLTPNGNNLPFQIKWADNTQPVQRDYGQAYDFLVGCYKESVRKKITAHDGFEQL